MSDNSKRLIHWSFWLIGIFALVWNIMGSINFVMQMNPSMLVHYPETERLMIEDRPSWATIGFAIAVFGGTFGSLLLLFKKSIAYCLFVASLLGVLTLMVYTISVGISFSMGNIIGVILLPILLAIFLIWYSKLAENRNWIG